MVREGVHHARRHDDELAIAPASREADGVVAHAEVRVAGAAARAGQAGDVPFADDAVARLDAAHARTHRVDDAAPFVTRDDREAHPPRIEGARRDVEIGAANAGADATDAYVAWAGLRSLHLTQGDGVRLLDHDCAHWLRG